MHDPTHAHLPDQVTRPEQRIEELRLEGFNIITKEILLFLK